MSKKIRPKATRLRKSTASKNVKNKELDDKQRSNLAIEWQTKVIAFHNEKVVGKTNKTGEKSLLEYFNNIQLETGMVVQVYKENLIKDYKVYPNGETSEINAYLRHIDGRERVSDAPKWVTAPFPVISKGIIMSISPSMKLNYYKRCEELSKYNPSLADNMIIPEVGDTVYLKTFMMKDKRFYVNKNDKVEDRMASQFEYSLEKFDWLFLIDGFEIESIVKRGSENTMFDSYKSLDDRKEIVDVKIDTSLKIDE